MRTARNLSANLLAKRAAKSVRTAAIQVFRQPTFRFYFMNLTDSRRLFKILLLLVLTCALAGCEVLETVDASKIPQSEIQQTYVVTASREGTFATAHFYHGNWGKSVELDASSKIEYNGAILPRAPLSFPFGTRYEKNLRVLETRHSFVYTNRDGKVFRNELSFEPVELPSPEITVSRSQEVKIQLSRAVGKEETVSISLKSLTPSLDAERSNGAPQSDKPATEDYQISLTDELDDQRRAIILKPKNLKRFVTGKATLRLEVSRTLSLQQAAPAGGTMRWSYHSTSDATVVN